MVCLEIVLHIVLYYISLQHSCNVGDDGPDAKHHLIKLPDLLHIMQLEELTFM